MSVMHQISCCPQKLKSIDKVYNDVLYLVSCKISLRTCDGKREVDIYENHEKIAAIHQLLFMGLKNWTLQ